LPMKMLRTTDGCALGIGSAGGSIAS